MQSNSRNGFVKVLDILADISVYIFFLFMGWFVLSSTGCVAFGAMVLKDMGVM